jgi:hypothetical protein
MTDETRRVGGNVRELPPGRGPWRWVRRLALGAVALAVAVVAGHGAWGRHAAARLDAALGAYRAAGDAVDPAALAPAVPVPDAENAALDWMEAGAVFDSGAAAVRALYSLDDVSLPLDEAELKAIGKAARVSREALRRAEVAAGKARADWKRGADPAAWLGAVPWYRAGKELDGLIAFEALRAHQLGDDRGAVARVRQLLALARAVDGDPILYAHDTASGLFAEACELLFQIAPRLTPGEESGRASPAALRALIAELLDDGPAHDALVRAIKGERLIRYLRARSFAERETYLDDRAIQGWDSWAIAYAYRPLALADAVILMRHADEVGAAVAVARDWPTVERGRALSQPAEVRESPTLHAVAGLLSPRRERGLRLHYNALALRRLAATALAARLFAADHGGARPAELDELVPAYLPAVPVDPMAAGGRAIGYRNDGPQPAVYSVGDDGSDDSGSERPRDRRGELSTNLAVRRWETRDAVVHLLPQPRIREVEEEE